MSSKRQPLRKEHKEKKTTLITTEKKERTVKSEDGEENEYHQAVQALKAASKFWYNIFDKDLSSSNDRMKCWEKIEAASQELCQKYAWAVPDNRAIKILKHFSPLVEIGAGKGYWTSLLREAGVDIIAFDKFLGTKVGKSKSNDKNNWTEVLHGDPSLLLSSKSNKKTKDNTQPSLNNRTLFLCYPDEAESMAATCLENYQGEYIVHVGEMISTGTVMGPPVAPFGRTSSADFQVSLAEQFHCILVAKLSVTYPISRDCISVWKRTKFVKGVEVTNFVNADILDPVSTKQSSNIDDDDEEEDEVPKKGKKRSNSKIGEEKNSKKAKKSQPESASSAVEFIDINNLAALREAALDQQYNEDNDALWASIPEEETLPVDRAAPCLAHLL